MIFFFENLGSYSVNVICRNKKDGKQRASQKMLALLHPGIYKNFISRYIFFPNFHRNILISRILFSHLNLEITSFGGLLKLYGSHAAMLQKNKKEKESEVL